MQLYRCKDKNKEMSLFLSVAGILYAAGAVRCFFCCYDGYKLGYMLLFNSQVSARISKSTEKVRV